MSTATATTTTTTTKASMPTQGLLPLKAPDAPLPSSSSSAEATLQSLYNRAAQAFLYRDIVLTATLIASAFALLEPPPAPAPDRFDAHRRKWDILRITLESTVYTAPPDRESLPETLRETLLLSPQLFATSSHERSLALFTPSSLPRTATSAFLPHQVLITLVASSIQVNCPDVGRVMIERWLSDRGQYDFIPTTGEAYAKVLELYCLHILPRLDEWDYAREFLSYEVELPPSKRTELQASLEKALKDKATRVPVPARLPSPAPSASSSSSSLSTLSNHTAVPLNGHSKFGLRQRTGSSASVASDLTVTRSRPHRSARNSRSTPRGTSRASILRGPVSETARQSPGALIWVKESLITYFRANRLTVLAIVFLLLPIASYIIRLRRSRAVAVPASTADQVKRRLFDAREGSVLHRLWNELVKAIWDTVRMGGGGLV